MYRIGIVGHEPNRFSDRDVIMRRIDQVIDLVGYQYGDDLAFNVCGNIGVGEWAAESCIARKYKYHLFLPCPIEITSKFWYAKQQYDLEKHYTSAYATTIGGMNYSADTMLDINARLVDSSDFIICFWVGKKQGCVFETIKYAFGKNKLVLDGANELKLITNQDTGKKGSDGKWKYRKTR